MIAVNLEAKMCIHIYIDDAHIYPPMVAQGALVDSPSLAMCTLIRFRKCYRAVEELCSGLALNILQSYIFPSWYHFLWPPRATGKLANNRGASRSSAIYVITKVLTVAHL